jgi:SAM-dependent MidA family methyltransferase
MKQLEDKIRLFIQNNGPITFESFMEFALYDKEFGYYTRHSNEFGKSGDFYTSPTVHRAFGQVISNFIVRFYEIINGKTITVIELGSGNGYLALDILDTLKRNNKKLYSKLNYICIDSSPGNLKKSKDLLADHKEKVKWQKDISELESKFNAIVLSNEFFDSLPFHRIRFKDNKPQEIYVSVNQNGFFELLDELSNSEIQDVIDNLQLNFAQDQQIEINLSYKQVFKQISNILNKGIVLSFDYGYLQKELYSPKRFEGTYRCFHNHKLSVNPYQNIGEQDITSSVDFSSLINCGQQVRLNTIKYTTQGQFLVDWGILDIIEKASEKERVTIKNLFLPGSMGDMFKVLIQEKNMKELLRNFYPESVLKISYQTTEDRI